MAAARAALRWSGRPPEITMALPPRQVRPRAWRRLALATLLALLLSAYWMTLQRLDASTTIDAPPPAHASPGLDRHTPRVN